MRLASILLLTIPLLCLSINALAIEPGDIAEPSISAPDMSMPTPVITRPSMDVPQTQPRPRAESNTVSSPAANQTGNFSSNQTQEIATQQEDKPLDLSGKWTIKFDNAANRWLDLTLWTTAGTSKVMGFGTLKDGSMENPVTLVGSLAGQELTLNVKPATSQNQDEYDLDLFLENSTLSGTYLLKSGGQQYGQGNATATRR